MSTNPEEKNMESSWKTIMMTLIKDFNSTNVDCTRLDIVHQIFDFMVQDLSWKTESVSKFLLIVTKKLTEFKHDLTLHPTQREYFRLIEERMGVLKYCCAKTVAGYRCGNIISMNKKHDYCHTHSKKIKKLSRKINGAISISSDMSFLISEYT